MSTYGDPMFRWKMAGIIATAAIVLSVPLHAIKENRARAARSRLAGPMATFVGRDSCVDCHEAATDAWRG